MSNPLGEKVAEAVKSLGAEMKEAVEALSSKVEQAVGALTRELDRFGRTIRPGPPRTTLRFVAQAPTELGEIVHVVGNHASLGDWQPERGLALNASEYPSWAARVDLEPGTQIEYKYVRKNRDGSFTWEAIDANRELVAGDLGSEIATSDEVRWG